MEGRSRKPETADRRFRIQAAIFACHGQPVFWAGHAEREFPPAADTKDHGKTRGQACPTYSGFCGNASTASNGTYTVTGLATGSYMVQFSDPNGTDASGYYSTSGFTPDWNSATAVTVPPNATNVNVQLPLGLTISGTVTGPGAAPLANINVNANPTFNGSGGGTTTAADGTYTVTVTATSGALSHSATFTLTVE